MFQRRFGNLHGIDGIDSILQTVFQYRKKDPASLDEEECIHNLFNCICSILSIPDNQSKFRLGEGFELMMRCLKELKYAALCAVRVINYAITDNRPNAEKFVEVGGLKHIFPMVMGRGLPQVVAFFFFMKIQKTLELKLRQILL